MVLIIANRLVPVQHRLKVESMDSFLTKRNRFSFSFEFTFLCNREFDYKDNHLIL